MPDVRCGDLRVHWEEWGSGETKGGRGNEFTVAALAACRTGWGSSLVSQS
jgi:hypothetical protein